MILALSAGALSVAQPPTGQAAEANLDVLVDAIRSNRKALVAVNLKLTDDEAAKFWPAYDRYQKELNAIGDRLVGVIQDCTANFSDLSNEKAMKLVDDYLAVFVPRCRTRSNPLRASEFVVMKWVILAAFAVSPSAQALARQDLSARWDRVREMTAQDIRG